jgi:hypothetical protein
MPNPEICDKCWSEYLRAKDIAVVEASCDTLEQWFCPAASGPSVGIDYDVKRDDAAPAWCLKLFEHGVLEGMRKC